ncbi:hypothetical protein AB0M46_07635 [Dactylosporangium sp. NPDC051485]
MQQFTVIATFMRDAMIGMLRASGFEAAPIDDYTLRPPVIHVLGG